MTNYYKLLQVDPAADLRIIEKAYRTVMLELKNHPDLGGDPERAKQLNAAMEIMRSPQRRSRYDNDLDRSAPRIQAPTVHERVVYRDVAVCSECGTRNALPPMGRTRIRLVCGKCRAPLASGGPGSRARRRFFGAAELLELIRSSVHEFNRFRSERPQARVSIEKGDFQGLNLTGINLAGAYLRGSNFFGARLRDADLSGANLNLCNLTKAELMGADLSAAAMIRALVIDAGLDGCRLQGANLHFSIFDLYSIRTLGVDPEQMKARGVHIAR